MINRLLLILIIIPAAFIFIKGNLTVRTLNNEAGHLSTTGTVSKNRLNLQTSFFDTDSNTVIHFVGFDSNTAISGSEFSDLDFTLTGTDSTSSEIVTLGTTSIMATTRTFNGTGNYLQNNSSPIIVASFGDFSIDAIVNLSGITGNNRIFGNLSSSPLNGIQCVFETSGNKFRCLRYNNGSTDFDAIFTEIGVTFTNKWAHIVMRYDAAATTGELAYKIEDIITNMDGTGGSGQPDAVSTDTSVSGVFTASPANWLLGHGYAGELGVSNASFNGKIAEFRISDVKRY